jgi:acyl carrier protein
MMKMADPAGGTSDTPAPPPPVRTAAEIEQWLVEHLAGLLAIEPAKVDVEELFYAYGLSSREEVILSGDLEAWLGRELSPTVTWDYPTIAALSLHLGESSAAPEISDTPEISAGAGGQRGPAPKLG